MSAKETSKQIRKELKSNFPKVKFSVRTKSYNTCDIDWVDGPTQNEVNDIVRKYQLGHFNGMTDSYEYDNRNEDLAQCRFVMVQRTLSIEAKLAMIGLLSTKWDFEFKYEIKPCRFSEGQYIDVLDENVPNSSGTTNQLIHREAVNRQFSFSQYIF